MDPKFPLKGMRNLSSEMGTFAMLCTESHINTAESVPPWHREIGALTQLHISVS